MFHLSAEAFDLTLTLNAFVNTRAGGTHLSVSCQSYERERERERERCLLISFYPLTARAYGEDV